MNNLRRSFFNARLYLEGIRQLKIVGIMGAVIMAGAAFLIPLGDNISNANYEAYINGQWVHSGGRVVTYSVLELNPFIVATFFLLTPLMVLVLFHFLNKRNACDFYHAIPDTRTSLFISYGSAILTWNFAILLLSYVITAISGVLFRFVAVDYSQAFVVFINCIMGCFFMFGVFAIAMSLTGTIFTNFAVAVMILAVPRTIVTVFVYMLTSAVKIVPFSFSTSVLDDRLNVVTNLVTGLFIRGDVDGLFMWKSTLYTFIVGLLYCLIALLLFKKRKSEAAASAAVNQKLQCAIRQIPAIMISLIPLALIIDNKVTECEMEASERFGIVVLYLIAVLAYFIYELITTRKLRNLLKAIPGLLWLVVFNAAFYGLFFVSYCAILNNVPKTDDVKYVNINFSQQYYYRDDNFYSREMETINIESEEVKELLLSELERNAVQIKEKDSVWNYVENPSSYYIQNTTRILVEFHTGFGKKTRYVYVSPQKMDELLELLKEDERIADAVFEPVPLEDIKAYSYTGSEVTKEEIYEVYLAYIEDLKNMDKKEAYYNVMIDTRFYSSHVSNFSFTLNNNSSIYVSVGFYTPNAMQAYLKLINSNPAEQTNLLKELLNSRIWNNDEEYEYYNLGFDLTVYPEDDDYSTFYISGEMERYTEGTEHVYYSNGRYNLNSEESIEKLADIAKLIEGTDNITDKSQGNVLYIHYWETYKPMGKEEDTTVDKIRYYIIDDKTMKLLKELY